MGIGSHTKPNQGRTNDWITPRYIIEALGPFDLDPCACNPQPWLCAERNLFKVDDGLSSKWEGLVWLNPPYGRETGVWLKRLADHGDGIALIFARTETEMFWEQVWMRADAILFFNRRLYFYRPDGSKGDTNAGGPSCLVAYGKEAARRLCVSKLEGTICSDWRLI